MQRHLQDIDGVEPQSLAIQGRLWIDVLRQDLEVQRLHEQVGDLPLQTDIGQGRRLLHERRFVGHRLKLSIGDLSCGHYIGADPRSNPQATGSKTAILKEASAGAFFEEVCARRILRRGSASAACRAAAGAK